MGERVSKLDTSPLVSMCKERKEFIKAAKNCRYDLVAAFVMYLQSLLDVGNALNQYVEEELLIFGDSPQVSVSDYEPSEEDSHLKFPSDSESDLDSLIDHVHSNMEVPRGPHKNLEVLGKPRHYTTENEDQSAANMDPKCMKNRSNEMPRVIYGKSGVKSASHREEPLNLYSSHPHHINQENTRIPVDLLQEDLVHHEYNQRFSLSNRWEIPQSHHRYPQHVNQDLYGSPMGFSYYDDRFSQYPAEAISMYTPSSYTKFQKHGAKKNTPATALPTPPPPQGSTWDFLHLFSLNNDVLYENHINYSYKTWSNSSDCDMREVREREGIPDLEDEIDCDVREVRKREGIPDLEDENEQSLTETFDKKELKRGININSGDGTSNAAQLNSNEDALSDEEKELKDGDNATEKEIKDNSKFFMPKNLDNGTSKGVNSEAEETMVQGSESLGTSSVSTPIASCRMGLKEAVKDIKDEFQNLFDFGKEFSAVIEVGKLPHHPIPTKLRGYASFVLGLIIPSTVTYSHHPYMLLNQSASRGRLLSKALKRNNQKHVCSKFGDLSSSLDQLHVWEKKLYGEVMGEEKIRILYDKQCKRLKDLDHRGAESDKINDALASVRRLQSEINVAVASISVISREMHKLRDDKLLPELNKLIEGLIRLFKFMGTCHQKQFQAITEAKSHVHILDPGIRKHSNPRATLRLERLILNWGICFSNFVKMQKTFVKYLNEWLLRCILPEPEETADGIAPFSPSSIGAPPIFTLCRDWYHAIDSISEIGVSKAITNFASSLHQLYEKQKEEQAQKAIVDYLLKDYEHRLKSFHKKNRMSWHQNSSFIDMVASGGAVEAEVPLLGGLDESLASSRRRLIEQRTRHQEAIRQVNDAASSCLQVGLSPIFEVLGSYCMEHLKVYEQLRIPNAVSYD